MIWRMATSHRNATHRLRLGVGPDRGKAVGEGVPILVACRIAVGHEEILWGQSVDLDALACRKIGEAKRVTDQIFARLDRAAYPRGGGGGVGVMLSS